MADVDGIDERIAHQTADQADDTVRGQHLGGRERIAGGLGALHVVHRFHEVVDAERDGRHKDDAEELEAREDLVVRRERHGEAEIGASLSKLRPP
jgi:hypothetical protein